MAKKPTNFRLSDDTIHRLDYIAKSISGNKTEALEVSVKEKADTLKEAE